MAMQAMKLGIPVGDQKVSGILLRPEDPKALYLFAHGAGLGMAHPIMEANARGLAQRGIATLRYNFPYMEKGGGRPDRPALAMATVRAANAAAAQFVSDLPLFAGVRLHDRVGHPQPGAVREQVKRLGILGPQQDSRHLLVADRNSELHRLHRHYAAAALSASSHRAVSAFAFSTSAGKSTSPHSSPLISKVHTSAACAT
jgi:hypothetical protein